MPYFSPLASETEPTTYRGNLVIRSNFETTSYHSAMLFHYHVNICVLPHRRPSGVLPLTLMSDLPNKPSPWSHNHRVVWPSYVVAVLSSWPCYPPFPMMLVYVNPTFFHRFNFKANAWPDLTWPFLTSVLNPPVDLTSIWDHPFTSDLCTRLPFQPSHGRDPWAITP